MDRFLLDTTVLIDLSKDSGTTRASLDGLVAADGVLAVCAVSAAEFFAGVPVVHRMRWRWWIADFEYWDISREAAVLAGVFRFDLARQGRALHIPDSLMAATAVIADAILVTDNVKDYPMPGLKLLRLGQ